MNFIDKILLKKKYIFIILVIIAFISSITLFLIPNMSRGHDIYFHLSRILAIKDNLSSGIIGGYIYPNYLNGYGYGNPLFYPDLFLYIPATLSYLGLNIITSYKIFLFLINIVSVFAMFFTVDQITKNKKCALLSSIVYGFSAYRLIDMYTRAALGETLAFIFAPLVILGIYEIIYGDYKKFYILTIGMSGLIFSHLISTYMIGIILIALCLVNIQKFWKEKKRIVYLGIAAVITLAITSYFLFPMLEQMIDGKFAFNNLTETSKLLERSLPLWSIFLEFPYHIFKNIWIPTGIGIGFLILIYYYIKNFKKCSQFIHFCFLTALIVLFCSTNLFPWNLVENIMSPIQFPWRFYFISTLLISVGGGILFNKLEFNLNKKIVVMFVVCLLPVITVSILNFCEKNIAEVNDYEISFGEYMPIPATKESVKERGEVIIAEHFLNYTLNRDDTNLYVQFDNNIFENKLELPILYYKGYSASINGENLEVYKTTNGLLEVVIPNIESGTICVSYTGTTIQTISKAISLISVIIFVMYIFIKKRGVI